MEAVSYTSIKGTYEKVPCTLDDIDSDILLVEAALAESGIILENKDEYIDNMIQSIYQELAFAILHNGERVGFMYNRIDGNFPTKLTASSLVMPKDTVALMILMLTISLSKYRDLIVFPHGRNLTAFKSFITKKSLRLYNCGALEYVRISKREFSTKIIRSFVKLYKIKRIK